MWKLLFIKCSGNFYIKSSISRELLLWTCKKEAKNDRYLLVVHSANKIIGFGGAWFAWSLPHNNSTNIWLSWSCWVKWIVFVSIYTLVYASLYLVTMIFWYHLGVILAVVAAWHPRRYIEIRVWERRALT